MAWKRTPTRLQQERKALKAEFEALSDTALEEAFQKALSYYGYLKGFLDRSRERERRIEEITSTMKTIREQKALISSQTKLNVFERLIGNRPIEDPRIAEMDRRLATLTKEFDKLWASQAEGQTEIDERKRLYHELRVIRAVRKQRRNDATKALAAAHLGRIRSSSQSLKTKSLKAVGTPTCPYCDYQVDASDLVLDHIYPVSKGGLGTSANTVLVCAACNSAKGARTLSDFCEIEELDFMEVRARLKALGKSV
jgi:5-methylcytosine-specific restriction endonuclease McrA